MKYSDLLKRQRKERNLNRLRERQRHQQECVGLIEGALIMNRWRVIKAAPAIGMTPQYLYMLLRKAKKAEPDTPFGRLYEIYQRNRPGKEKTNNV